jgi:hypothetical protein
MDKNEKDKHRPYHVQKRQRTNTGHTMDKKDKGQTQATKWTRKTKDKHTQYNVQQRQRTNTGHTIYKNHKGKA